MADIALGAMQVIEGSGAVFNFFNDKSMKGQFAKGFALLKMILRLLRECEGMAPDEESDFLVEYDTARSALEARSHYTKFPQRYNPISWNEIRIVVNKCHGLYFRVDQTSEGVRRREQQVRLIQKRNETSPATSPEDATATILLKKPTLLATLTSILAETSEEHKVEVEQLAQAVAAALEPEDLIRLKRIISVLADKLSDLPVNDSRENPFLDASQTVPNNENSSTPSKNLQPCLGDDPLQVSPPYPSPIHV